MVLVLNILHVVLGLLYFIAGIVLIMNLKPAVMTSMTVIFLGYVIFIVILRIHLNAYVDYIYLSTKTSLKLKSILGLFDGSYSQQAAAARDRGSLMLNMGIAFASVIYLTIPSICFVKAFLQEEKK